MCIHIASPQHSAINYLQNFDMAFVAAKPPALYTKPPSSLQELLGYNERNVSRLFLVSSNHVLRTV